MSAGRSAAARLVPCALALLGLHGAAGAVGTAAGSPSADPTTPTWPEPVHRPTAAGATALDSTLARLAERLRADVEADGVGSIAAAVVVGDSVVWSAAFGAADPGRGIAATPATVYRIGSISKTVTAVVLMRLVEAGVVALDDPVAPHVPELAGLANHPVAARPITFRDLAAHTAGLDREPAASHAARGSIRTWRRKVLQAIPVTAARTEPGAAYLYSNIGYGILGLALERAAGRPFDRLVRDYVFDPLGMTRSSFTAPTGRRPGLAVGYVNLDDGTIDPRVPRAEHRGRGYRVPSEGVYSTVDDLARLAMGLSGALGDALLSAESRAEMLRPQAPDAVVDDLALGGAGLRTTGAGYGLGLQLTRVAGALVAGHSGTAAGYTGYLAFDPDSRIAIVLLRSYNQGSTNLGALSHEVILELRDARDELHDPGDAPPLP